MNWTKAYIGLGSNLGDRRGYMTQAVDRLMRTPGVVMEELSSIYETQPEGMASADAGAFLNAVVGVRTTLEPETLLEQLRAIERALGRERPDRPPADTFPEAGGSESRTIDLDLLLYGDRVIRRDDLTIPHPRMHLRRFVLDPLCELAADMVHPVLGKSFAVLAREAGVSS